MAEIHDIFTTESLGIRIISNKHIISNFEYVKEGDIILEDKLERITIKSPYSGYFVLNNAYFPSISARDKLGIVADTIEDAISALHYTNPKLERDPFTDTQKIVWKERPRIVYSPLSWYESCVFILSKQLFFSFEFIDNKGVIVFKADNNLKLSKNDHISILFDNGTILDFHILEKPVNNGLDTITCTLYQDDIDTFLRAKMVSYRLTYNKEGKSPITKECGYFYGKYLFEATTTYVNYFIGILKELIPDYHLPRKNIEKTFTDFKFNWCYVYLMKDKTNGYHKIGISNTPEYRERTLQSEKPSIELLAYKKFPTRKIAEAIESALHTAYSQQRVRGEWFNLNEEDVAAIIETLK